MTERDYKMELNEAIKRIEQETIACTYNRDFSKSECLQVIKDSIKQKDDTIQALKEYLIKWNDMLQVDGVNSKSMVRNDIQHLLGKLGLNNEASKNN